MNNHFAKLGDVWKHLPLAEILRVNPPRHYWETHAGSASYALTESPARLHGALRFLSRAPCDPDLYGCAYVLVHIDPFDPYERVTSQSQTPIELAAWLARAGYRLFYWYGYDSIKRRGWAHDEISRLTPGLNIWCGDALMPACLVYPGRTGAWGCGVVLANMTSSESRVCERLGSALERISVTDAAPGNDPSQLTFRVIR